MRYKRVQVTPYLFSLWFTEGNEIHAKCVKGLPEGAKVAYVYFTDYYYINVVFEHELFEELKAGQIIPTIDPPLFEKLSCAPEVTFDLSTGKPIL